MNYADYGFFYSVYGSAVPGEDFERLLWDAQRLVDAHTTGIDGVRKLRVAFPTDEYDAEAVKRCVCKLIMLAYDNEQAKKARQPVKLADGTMAIGPVASVSSGSESISYSAADAANATANESDARKGTVYIRAIREMLSGVCDANGVCLLYMGVYPRVC